MPARTDSVRDFVLPDLGEGLTEGEIASWLVEIGDTVEVDQAVAEVETAKAVVEIPSPFAGVVITRHAEVGEEVEVGQPLISIDTDPGAGAGAEPSGGGEVAEEVAGGPPAGDQAARAPEVSAGGDQGPGQTPDEAEASDMVPETADISETAETPGPAATPAAAEAPESDDGDSGNVLVGYGTGGRARSRRRRGAAAAPDAPGAGAKSSGGAGPPPRPLAKPPVRRMAKDLGVELAAVAPSGEGGIVTREDVRVAAGQEASGPATEAVPERAGLSDGSRTVGPAGERRADRPGDERIPLKGVRKMIAEKMTVSRVEIPDATTWVDCDATALTATREELNAAQSEVRVSPLALILRACVAGLRRYPQLNASLDTEASEIVLHRAVHLGFAAQTDRGLVVPVIADAQEKSTLEIAEELNALAGLARDGKLAPGQMTGSTFTVSNYGSFGVDGGSPIINHPEAAILGVGRISERPWVHGGEVAIRHVVQLSIAFDHRICDGGEAAGFLRFIADCVERPALLLGSL
jgi:pyruvate dehydrogenase E2 component (dihydrolipoamide acetyltransferase)